MNTISRTGIFRRTDFSAVIAAAVGTVADVPLQDRSQRSFREQSVKRIDVAAKSAAEGNCSLIFNFKK